MGLFRYHFICFAVAAVHLAQAYVALAQTPTPVATATPAQPIVFNEFQKCVNQLKTMGGSSPGTIRECSDSSKDPTWVGAPAYTCAFDSVEGDLRGEDPSTQYHEARHISTSWLCERITYPNGKRKYALYKNGEFEWTYGVANGTRIYAGRRYTLKALWQKSEIQSMYVLCPNTMQVVKEHYNGMSGGSVAWTTPPAGATEFEPKLYFPKKHKTVSFAYFDGPNGSRPCKMANPYAGRGKSFSINPPHNRPGAELPQFDDGVFNIEPEWRTPPRR